MRKCCPTMVVRLKTHMFTPLCGLREKNKGEGLWYQWCISEIFDNVLKVQLS